MAYLPPQRTLVDMITFDADGKLVLLGDLNHTGVKVTATHTYTFAKTGVSRIAMLVFGRAT
jgi:hypothetical protein